MRTPFYGACLVVAAMIAGVAVQVWWHPATVFRVVVMCAALLVALAGFVMTFRDLTPPRR